MLWNQEQISGPENAPIARFDGFGCYQTRSEKKVACEGAGDGRKPLRGRAWLCSQAVPFRMPCAREQKLNRPPRRCPSAETPLLNRPNQNAVSLAAGLWRLLCFSLSFQEQIKGPENASIARFDGFGCYQTRSE